MLDYRDKYGVRPLTIGKIESKTENQFIVSSESCSFPEGCKILYDINLVQYHF